MRDILFKAKRIYNGEWVEGLLWKNKYKTSKIFISCFPDKDDNEEVYVVDSKTICQYTGLTDKDGNKIWENDIVWVGVTDRTIVIFSEKYSGYILQPIGDFYFDSPMLVDNVDIIDNIIGNIFDNPELLEGGANNE